MRGLRRVFMRRSIAQRIANFIDNRMGCPVMGINAATGLPDPTAQATTTYCEIVDHPSGDGRCAILIDATAESLHIVALRNAVLARIARGENDADDIAIRDAPTKAALAVAEWARKHPTTGD